MAIIALEVSRKTMKLDVVPGAGGSGKRHNGKKKRNIKHGNEGGVCSGGNFCKEPLGHGGKCYCVHWNCPCHKKVH